VDFYDESVPHSRILCKFLPNNKGMMGWDYEVALYDTCPTFYTACNSYNMRMDYAREVVWCEAAYVGKVLGDFRFLSSSG